MWNMHWERSSDARTDALGPGNGEAQHWAQY
jgi:hypothetical protein